MHVMSKAVASTAAKSDSRWAREIEVSNFRSVGENGPH